MGNFPPELPSLRWLPKALCSHFSSPNSQTQFDILASELISKLDYNIGDLPTRYELATCI